jgi:hypothetical protein
MAEGEATYVTPIQAYEQGTSEWVETFSDTGVATGEQTITCTLTKGTTRLITEVSLYITGSPGDAAYFKVHRTNGTPAAGDLQGTAYYNCQTSLFFTKPLSSTTNLKIVVDHNKGGANTADVFITVKYFYY